MSTVDHPGEDIPVTDPPKKISNIFDSESQFDISARLNRYAAYIILTVVAVLMLFFVSFIFGGSKEPLKSLDFNIDSVHLPKFDSSMIAVNHKFISDFSAKMDSLREDVIDLKDIKQEIEETRKKNEDYFRLILALVGSVFAIVGFFGFKSISDTRQATLDAAKIKAESIAITSATTKAESTVREYLKSEGSKILEASAKSVAESVAKDVAYTTASSTAENSATIVSNQILGRVQGFQTAQRQDIEILERELNGLRARIIDLEAKLFGSDPPDSPATSNPVKDPDNPHGAII